MSVKIVSFVILGITCLLAAAGAVEKPVLKAGMVCKSSFELCDRENIYPGAISDRIYLDYRQKLFTSLVLYSSISVEYINTNKYASQPADLYGVRVHPVLAFRIVLHKYTTLYVKYNPKISVDKGKVIYKNYSTLTYKFKMDNFSFMLTYSNTLGLEDETLMFHRIVTGFEWSIPRMEWVRYKAGCTINIQHYKTIPIPGENRSKPLLRDSTLTFEVIMNFNSLEIPSSHLDEDDYE